MKALKYGSCPNLDSLVVQYVVISHIVQVLFASSIYFFCQEDIKFKMPSLYLLDSILKNVGGDYIKIISQHMIEIFTNVFAKVSKCFIPDIDITGGWYPL